MKKKVFFIMNTNDYSGAEAVNFSIIECLNKEYDFYWVSRKGKINDYLEKSNIKWIEIKELSRKEIKRVVKQYKPDILHATDFTSSVVCALSHVKTPLICHLHHNAPWIKKINIKSISFMYAALRSKKVLTVSESINNEYIFSRLINNKMICIGNPVSREKILSRISSDKKTYDICCVARLTEPKDPKRFVDTICEIKKKCKNLKCVWVGDGELKDDIIKYSIKKDVDKNIEFVGFKENPYYFMNKSKIFLLTSKWEGFGLVAFEALTLGLPCVVTNVGGLSTIVDDNCGKLCNSNNDFMKEIVKLLINNNYYKKKSENAVNKSIELDNYNDYKLCLQKIYNSLIK